MSRLDRRKLIISAASTFAASSFPEIASAQRRMRRYRLPELPPMPQLPARLPEQSVDMASPADWPETRLNFPIARGPFEPTWDAISSAYPQNDIAWLREAKFGVWVHFGAQAAGRSGDWYARGLYDSEERFNTQYSNHLRNFGHPSEVGYKDVLRTWNPALLDPRGLVELYHQAGARFLFLLGVHHDNFDNWDSRYQKWNAVNIGPKRDLIREWTSAARSVGMRYGITFHHEYTWWWWQSAFGADKTGPKAGIPYDGNLTLGDGAGKWWEGYDPRMLYTVNLREYRGLDNRYAPVGGIFQNHQEYAKWYATWWAYRIMDAIEKYDPDFIYTDGNSTGPFTGEKSGTGMKSNAIQRVVAHFYNRTLARREEMNTFSIVKFHPPARGVVNTQEGVFPEGIKRDQPWIGETPIGDWFYRPGFVYEASSVIRYLLENASRDGATAVCISLRPDGSLDPECRAMLAEIGDWMRVNGSGVYASSAWSVFGEGEMIDGKLKVSQDGPLGPRQAAVIFNASDFRFTHGKDGAIYAFCLMVPRAGEQLLIRSLAAASGHAVKGVTLMGYDGPLEWRQEETGLRILAPANHGQKIALGFRVVI